VGISRPSHVQAEAYKALGLKSGFKHVAVADQAGSGKTLAYLLPLLQQLKEREQQQGGPVTQPNSPSIIILTPTTGEGCCRNGCGIQQVGGGVG
jgi:ATP-dependent RNA helicase DDX18/HAS1